MKLVTSERAVEALSKLLWEDFRKMESDLAMLDEEPVEFFLKWLPKTYFAKIPEAVRLATPFVPMFAPDEEADGVELVKRRHLLAFATESHERVAMESISRNCGIFFMLVERPCSAE